MKSLTTGKVSNIDDSLIPRANYDNIDIEGVSVETVLKTTDANVIDASVSKNDKLTLGTEIDSIVIELSPFTNGEDGVTYYPHVSANGTLSWTNDKGYENPASVNIKGDSGVSYIPSINSEGILSWTNDKGYINPDPILVQGHDGVNYTPHISETGILTWTNDKGYENPDPIDIMGKDGKDAVTFTPHISEDGILTWTNDGTNVENPLPYTVKGTDGIDGEDGVTFVPHISAEGILSWTNNGGLVNPSDYNVKGKDGADGENGATFTPHVNDEGLLTWTNDKELENPQDFSFPMGSMIVDAEYIEETGKIKLTLTTGTSIEMDATNLIGGFVSQNEFINKMDEIDSDLSDKIDEAYVEDGYLYLLANGNTVAQLTGFGGTGGGGTGSGGSSNNAVLTFTNQTGWLSKSISTGSECILIAQWSSLEDGYSTGNGTLSIAIDGVNKRTLDVEQGTLNVDVTSLLSTGTQKVKLTMTDAYDNSRTLTFTITSVDLTITSTFEDKNVCSGSIKYAFVATGNTSKTVHFILDGTEIGNMTVLVSGRQSTYTIPEQTHGHHSLKVYFTATVDGVEVSSNVLVYDLICVVSGNNTPIIATTFEETEVTQYSSFSIEYYVYDPSTMITSTSLYANDTLVNVLSTDRTKQTWTYRPDTLGTLTLKLVCGSTTRTITLDVKESEVKASAETADLELYLTSYGRTNTEANPSSWVYGDISATLSDFNFTSDGWVLDDESVRVLRVSGDARVTIPLKLFKTDFRNTGKTIEIEFATKDVLNYDTIILNCMDSDGRGIRMTPQKVEFASEQSSMSVQYKENEHVRISFVIEKSNEHRLMYCYLNGIMSEVIQYPEDDDFAQYNPLDISIGSSECTTDIYCIRVYDNDLTRYQIVDNWIADTQNGSTRLSRYTENNIYDDYGNIVISKLPKTLPYIVLQGTALPTYKGDKRTISGYYVDPVDASKSFSFTDASADVQGTSSQYYARKNFKIKFKNFTYTSTGETATKYKLRDDSVAVSTFTFKADVASSEGANNVELVGLYNDICPYKTLPQQSNSYVRQGIDGFPIVMFWDNGESVTFVGKYNFNNDKGTETTFGFQEGDESWETLDNTLALTQFKEIPDLSDTETWVGGFEGRYPDGNTDYTNLRDLALWINSTDTTAATGNTLDTAVTYDGVVYTTDTAEYRLAKFKNELSNWFDVDDCVFYYLYTELFLMIDSRVKNSFPTNYQNGVWCWLPYDMDTAIGINNEGSLVFDYSLEDVDKTESGADVYNGQDSVMWNNMRMAFSAEVEEMYQDLRSKGLDYDTIEKRFEDHQSYWSASIFNEDAQYKYIDPLIDTKTDYLNMCQGSKAEQRKWWLWNRFRYIDSKYNTGDAKSSYINFRAYANSDFYITPYADIYIRVQCGSYSSVVRAKRNTQYHLVLNRDNANDTETMIFSADQLSDIGDLSGFKVGFCNIAAATKLKSLIIGCDTPNLNLTNLTLGNNVLLKKIDVRNCPNLAQAIDASGCTNIEEAYFEGTSITSLSLPNGGILKVLHLPDTITNLTLRNQSAITDFQLAGYSNISTLRLEGVSSAVPMVDIFNGISKNSRIRLTGIKFTVNTAAELAAIYDRLSGMRGIDENGNNVDQPQIQGDLYIDTIWAKTLGEFNTNYPDLTIHYNKIAYKTQFYSYDGSVLLYEVITPKGDTAIYSAETPTKVSTAQFRFDFAGWSYDKDSIAEEGILEDMQEDKVVYAAFNNVTRTYTVYFYNLGNLLWTKELVPYGTTVTYEGPTPTATSNDLSFYGWEPLPESITGDTYCYAIWVNSGTFEAKYFRRSGDIYEINSNTLTSIRDRAFDGFTNIVTINCPNVISVGNSAFYSYYYGTRANNLSIAINICNATEIGDYAFMGYYNYAHITELNLSSAVNIGKNAFYFGYYAAAAQPTWDIEELNLWNVQEIEEGAFQAGNSYGAISNVFTTLTIGPNIKNIKANAFMNFMNCANFKTINIVGPANIKSHSFWTNRSYSAVENIYANNAKVLEGYALQNIGSNAKGLINLYLYNVEKIYTNSFTWVTGNNSGYTNLYLGDKLQDIYPYSAHTYGISDSSYVRLMTPLNLMSINFLGVNAFMYWTNIQTIILGPLTPNLNANQLPSSASSQANLDLSKTNLIVAKPSWVTYSSSYPDRYIIVPDDLYETYLNRSDWTKINANVANHQIIKISDYNNL